MAVKRKPVAKRRRYDSGGFVDEAGDQLADVHNEIASRKGGMSHEQSERWIAAREAMMSARANESGRTTAGGTTNFWANPNKTVTLGRANYPGFKKGGKVAVKSKGKRK